MACAELFDNSVRAGGLSDHAEKPSRVRGVLSMLSLGGTYSKHGKRT
jgi:hypothetical protein